MKKIELKIIGLSYSQKQTGSYILVLGAMKGDTKLPIIIKSPEAQFIATKMEGMKIPRPLIWDLFNKLTENVNLTLKRIYISNVLEGIFYSKLIFDSDNGSFEMDSSIGDAICLSLVHNCPVYCSQEVLDISGIKMSDDGSISEEQEEENLRDRGTLTTVPIENLEKMLQKAIENEEYEIASQLRDRILELKNKK